MKVDIIGGSLSGLSAAISLKENKESINVIVHEKHKKIGYNHEGRRCGEAHSVEHDWKKWIPEKKSIFNEITIGEGKIGNKHYNIPREPGTAYILNRQEFICQLQRKAEKLGVAIHTNDKIKSYKDLDGEFIIDASGCPSTIKKELGFYKGIKGITYQQTIENCNVFQSNTVKVYYVGKLGYFWIFPRDPKKKEVNLGIGYISNYNIKLKEKLEDFKRENKIKGDINYVCGGLIPLGLQRPFMYKNILFVGDACVGAFIITGQGIYRALMSGDIAGKCIAKGYPKRYSSIIYKEFLMWDILCKLFYNTDRLMWKINPDSNLNLVNYFIGLTGMSH